MKALLSFALAVCLFGLTATIPAQEVQIPDPGLNAAIREALQKPVGPLTEADLLTFTELDASKRNVKSVAGLEAAHRLESLNLQSNQLSEVVFAIGLSQLQWLSLSQNLLHRLALAPDMTNLTSLDRTGLSGCRSKPADKYRFPTRIDRLDPVGPLGQSADRPGVTR